MKLFAKVFVSIMVGVACAYGALALDMSDGWVFTLYLVGALGMALALGVFDMEEPPCRHMTIAEGLRWRKAA